MRKLAIVALFLLAVGDHAWSQQPSQSSVPVYRITVVARTIKAVNYRHRSGTTKIGFRGTALMSAARGEARVESKRGAIEVEAEFERMVSATDFGPEYLTYVLWAISPEGRPVNLGEVLLSDGKGKLTVTSDLQAFGLMVTAEPHFAVTQPSDAVVLENEIRPDTAGKIELVDAKFELLQRGQYTANVDPSRVPRFKLDPKTPLELYEARNAVQIASFADAGRYASESFRKAQDLLAQAENYHARKAGRKPTITIAREAAQQAEDARLIAVKRQEEERLAFERQASAAREQRAKEEAEEEARRRAQAEAERQMEAERRARAEAEQAAALARQQAAQADAEKARLATQQAEQERQKAEQERQKAEQEKAELRASLLQQFNAILQTRETERGLVVNMSDVLFDSGKWTLKPGARERLAKITGILLAHPGLTMEVEGHTDSVGSDEFNQQLSERRAFAVRDFLIQQGVAGNAITARGLGKSQPVASNATAVGRQMNRRVELVVSGDIIASRIAGRAESLTTRR